MNKNILFALPLAFVALAGIGCGTTAVGGEHVGYITAIEKSGVIWKTGTVYLKTNTASTQEDEYCVENQGVYDGLKAANASSEKIKVNYHSEMATAPWRCDSVDIVDSFQTAD